MEKFPLASPQLYEQRFQEHLAYWERAIADNPTLNRRFSTWTWLLQGLGLAIVLIRASEPVKDVFGSVAAVGFSALCFLLLGLLLLGFIRQNNKHVRALRRARNRVLISPYLYAGFANGLTHKPIEAYQDLNLFYSVLSLDKTEDWVGAMVAQTELYFFPDQGLILAKDSLFEAAQPLIWSRQALEFSNGLDKLQFGYFPELEQAGHLYGDSKAEAMLILKEKEELMRELIQKYQHKLAIFFIGKRLFLHLPDYQPDLAYYNPDALLSAEKINDELRFLAGLLADFERL